MRPQLSRLPRSKPPRHQYGASMILTLRMLSGVNQLSCAGLIRPARTSSTSSCWRLRLNAQSSVASATSMSSRRDRPSLGEEVIFLDDIADLTGDGVTAAEPWQCGTRGCWRSANKAFKRFLRTRDMARQHGSRAGVCRAAPNEKAVTP